MYAGRAATSFMFIVEVVVVVHNIYHWTQLSTGQPAEHSLGISYTEWNIKK